MIEGTAPDCLTEAGRGWVSHIFVRRWLVLSLLSLIYILWLKLSDAFKMVCMLRPISIQDFFLYNTIVQWALFVSLLIVFVQFPTYKLLTSKLLTCHCQQIVKGTLVTRFLTLLIIKKTHLGPKWIGKNGFAKFFVFAKIFEKKICPRFAKSLTTLTQCQRGCWLPWHSVSVVVDYGTSTQYRRGRWLHFWKKLRRLLTDFKGTMRQNRFLRVFTHPIAIIYKYETLL